MNKLQGRTTTTLLRPFCYHTNLNYLDALDFEEHVLWKDAKAVRSQSFYKGLSQEIQDETCGFQASDGPLLQALLV